jgi:hypothetical protein
VSVLITNLLKALLNNVGTFNVKGTVQTTNSLVDNALTTIHITSFGKEQDLTRKCSF